ncbi:hypothetical protein VNI00_005204 [Paramarasmius palmivorus]|uniref:Homeobox domain-containing protein n=1 Tax=Paramarasmius palmivorus TaxID=297713 RepID=A0AAW0DHM3_9AGAR
MSATRSSRREQLHVDPIALPKPLDKDSNVSTPISSTTTNSPITPLTTPTYSTSSESTADYDAQEQTGSNDVTVKEKRKRCRVTPDQLVHLERIFATDRSPTAARRREISEMLGMQERQTQVWFQNRRAKAKMLEAKFPAPLQPPKLPQSLVSTDETDLLNLIHEDEVVVHNLTPQLAAVEVIPCTDLAIGSWRRIATASSKNDLAAYLCMAKQCLTWFVVSGGSGFKMELSFTSVLDAQFTSSSAGSGIAKITLTEPPLFYLEHTVSSTFSATEHRSWRRCSDWTEGAQATRVLQHELQGPAVHLARLVRTLLTNQSSRNISPVHQTVMEIPAPPLTGLGITQSHHSISPPLHEEASNAQISSANATSVVPYISVPQPHIVVPPVVHYPQPLPPLHTTGPSFIQDPYPPMQPPCVEEYSSWQLPEAHDGVPHSLSPYSPDQPTHYPSDYHDHRSFTSDHYHEERLPGPPQSLPLLTTPFYPNFEVPRRLQNQNISPVYSSGPTL